MSRPTLVREYRASALKQELDVSTIPDKRTLHTVFAILINDIDRRSDMHQSLKQEVLHGLAQAWLYHLKATGSDVHVEQHQHGIDTEVTHPDERRPASSISHNPDSPRFDERIRSSARCHISIAQFNRDMARLDDLRRKHSYPGLNTIESKEVTELRDLYGLSFSDWWQEAYRVDANTQSFNQNQDHQQTL